MRFWIGGPRVMGLRTGVSFGPEDFKAARGARSATERAVQQQITGSFVYVVTGDHNLVKIGVSSNPNARLASLQTGSPYPLRLSFVGVTPGAGYDVEAAAHDLLSAHRLEGEWFDCSPELAASAVMGGAAKIGQKLHSVEPRSINQILQIAGAAESPVDQNAKPQHWFIRLLMALITIAFILLGVLVALFVLIIIVTLVRGH